VKLSLRMRLICRRANQFAGANCPELLTHLVNDQSAAVLRTSEQALCTEARAISMGFAALYRFYLLHLRLFGDHLSHGHGRLLARAPSGRGG
jgi:hypothetical protein